MEGLPGSPVAPVAWNPLYSWHAHLIRVKRHKTVVLVHDHSRYVIVLYGLKVKDMADLATRVIAGIRETLLAEGVRSEAVKRFIEDSGEVSFAPAKNRSSITRVSRACTEVEYYEHQLNDDAICQSELGMRISRILVGGGDNYIFPHKEMFKVLEKYVSGSLFSLRVVELSVTLDLDSSPVSRTLQVPLSYSFRRFHTVLQRAFGWRNNHLHDFTILADDKPVAKIVCDEAALDLPPPTLPMHLEGKVKLAQYLPSHTKIEYQYDFGDGWIHRIEVLQVIEDSTQATAICIAGQGDTPPEDVGGAAGYAEFLSVIKDTRHPEYRQLMQWAQSQGYSRFNLDQVNLSLGFLE